MYVLDYLRSRSARFQARLHRPSSSAARLAASLHIPGRRVAKTVLVSAKGEHLLAVLPATSQVDLARLGQALGFEPRELKLASEAEIDSIFHDCEPGAIPPFGRLYQLRTLVDCRLSDAAEVLFPTNMRHLGIEMAYPEFARLEEPVVADFARPVATSPDQPGHRHPRRRAG